MAVTSSIQLEKLAMTRMLEQVEGLLFLEDADWLTVHKMDLILCSIERRLQMQYSVARMPALAVMQI
jgi:hypothetical protein